MSTWTAESEQRLFDARCPWCERIAERGARLHTYACSCGAIAFGAPVYEFEKVVQAAGGHFALALAPSDPRAGNPPSWEDAFGIEFREGGRVGEVDYYYWFKRR